MSFPSEHLSAHISISIDESSQFASLKIDVHIFQRCIEKPSKIFSEHLWPPYPPQDPMVSSNIPGADNVDGFHNSVGEHYSIETPFALWEDPTSTVLISTFVASPQFLSKLVHFFY